VAVELTASAALAVEDARCILTSLRAPPPLQRSWGLLLQRVTLKGLRWLLRMVAATASVETTATATPASVASEEELHDLMERMKDLMPSC